MKKNKTNSIAKAAKKALKKSLSEKIAAQIKITLGEFFPGVNKAEKSIEKAAKNLAKKLAKVTKTDIKVAKKVVSVKLTPPAPKVAITTAAIKASPVKVASPAKPEVKTPTKPAPKK
jgi:hypothetical protein